MHLSLKNGIAVAFLVALSWTSPGLTASTGPHWEAVNAQVAAGKSVRLDVRLVGTDGKPVTGKVTITQTRLDMGPDKMEMMTSPAQQIPSSQAGVTSVQADLPQAGHWALTISANVAGQTQPVSGAVIFTAVKR
jgi:hypothetical protein